MEKSFRLTIIFILALTWCSAQTNNTCDSIRQNPDTLAKYKNGAKDLLTFIREKVQPPIEDCYKNEGRMITNLKMQLTIDNNGKVISAYVVRPDLPANCRTLIQNEFLKMDNWTPAIQKGMNVCSKFILPINCIKWQ